MPKPHILDDKSDDNAIYSRALIQSPFLGIYMQGGTFCPHAEPWPPSGGTWQSQKQCLQDWIGISPLPSPGPPSLSMRVQTRNTSQPSNLLLHRSFSRPGWMLRRTR